jgi:hypothetical protein
MPNVVKIGGGVLGAVKKQIKNSKPLSKAEAKANKRGLKAANKKTKASKTFIGSNKNMHPNVRWDIIVNETKPARPNRERAGSLRTLRKQGRTGSK